MASTAALSRRLGKVTGKSYEATAAQDGRYLARGHSAQWDDGETEAPPLLNDGLVERSGEAVDDSGQVVAEHAHNRCTQEEAAGTIQTGSLPFWSDPPPDQAAHPRPRQLPGSSHTAPPSVSTMSAKRTSRLVVKALGASPEERTRQDPPLR
jgi:hypothetical protein